MAEDPPAFDPPDPPDPDPHPNPNPASDKTENAPNVYDQAIRHLLQSDPIGMIRWLVPKVSPHCRFLDWHDSRNLPFPGMGDLICDLIADLSLHPQNHPTHALVMEFMARAKTAVIDRALLYVVEAYRRLRHGKTREARYQTHVAVINLTGRNRPCRIKSGPPQAQDEVPDDEGWSFQPSIRNLCDDDAGSVLGGIEAGTIPFGALALVPLMKDGSKPDIMARWRKSAEQVKDEHWRPNLAPLAVLFAELRKRHKAWAKSLKGWDFMVSQVVQEWQADARKEGRQEGRQEGELKRARLALLTVLKARFRDLDGNGLESKIAEQTDLDVLTQWLLHASVASTIADFRKKTKL